MGFPAELLRIVDRPQVWILAGRPGMGKTELVAQIAENVQSQNGAPAVVLQAKPDGSGLRAVPAIVPLTPRSDDSWADRPRYWIDVTFKAVEKGSEQEMLTEILDQCREAWDPVLIVMDTYQSVLPAGVQSALQDRCITVLKDWSRSQRVSLLVLSQANPRPEDSSEFAPEPEDVRLPASQVKQADSLLLLDCEDHYHKGERGYRPTGVKTVFVICRDSEGYRVRVPGRNQK